MHLQYSTSPGTLTLVSVRMLPYTCTCQCPSAPRALDSVPIPQYTYTCQCPNALRTRTLVSVLMLPVHLVSQCSQYIYTCQCPYAVGTLTLVSVLLISALVLLHLSDSGLLLPVPQ